MDRRGRFTLLALLALLALAPMARARELSPWSFRLGGGFSQLEGALGDVYPDGAQVGAFGVAWRTSARPLRLRTGLGFSSHAGSGSVPVRGFTFVGTPPVLEYGVIGHIDETWRSSWIEVPLQAEFVRGDGAWRPYAGAGGTLAVRIGEHAESVLEVPVDGARRFAPAASLTLGLENRSRGGTVRFELAYGHGLSSLYAAADGPEGAWDCWSLLLDIGL